MRAVFFVLAFLLLAATIHAAELTGQQYFISVQENATGKIVELYYFSFLDSADKEEFQKTVQKNGSSLLAWQAFDSDIHIHFGELSDVANATFQFDAESDALVLQYDADYAIVQKTAEDPRTETWTFNSKLFREFDKGSIYVIPSTSTVDIVLPLNAIVVNVPEKAVVSENRIRFSNVSQTSLDIQYTLPKTIAPAPDTATLLKEFFDNRFNLIIVAILILFLVFVLWKRKEVGKKIEDFVVAHSEILPKEEIPIDIET